MVAIRDRLEPLAPYLNDQKVVKVLQDILGGNDKGYGSRWWIGDGERAYLLGDWIHDKDSKIWYSKDDYLPKAYEGRWRGGNAHPVWNTYGTPATTKDYGPRITEITVNTTLLFKNFRTKKLKVFSWAKWKKWQGKQDMCAPPTDIEIVAPAETQQGAGHDNIVEVFNSKNKCIAMIDSKSGETIWERDGNKSKVTEVSDDTGALVDHDPSRHCIDCGAQVSRSHSNDGLCPYCYAELWPPDGQTEPIDECPNCYERSYIIDSTFDQGDSECCRCGCLFWSTVVGKDGIVGWNEDTKAHRDEALKSLLKQHSEGL
jgi:hypothetical protein